MRRAVIAMLTCGALLAAVPAVQAGMPIEKVVGGPGVQYWPTSNGTFVAYEEYRRGYDSYVVNPVSGYRVKVNRPGTSGALGSFIQGTTKVLYQEYTRKRSDLYFFDIDGRDRSGAPGIVNRVGWEYWPQGSSDYLLFMRETNRYRTRSLVLFNRDTQGSRKLIRDTSKTVFPGFVGSRYAAWTLCGRRACSIFVFDTVSGDIGKLPTPRGKSDYAPAIDETAGIVYFSRGPSRRCGVNISIRRAVLGSPDSEPLIVLPQGIDTGWYQSLNLDDETGLLDLYFERWDCRETTGDVYAARSINAPGRSVITVPGRSSGGGTVVDPTDRGHPLIGGTASPPRAEPSPGTRLS